jgi:hypothetical protein
VSAENTAIPLISTSIDWLADNVVSVPAIVPVLLIVSGLGGWRRGLVNEDRLGKGHIAPLGQGLPPPFVDQAGDDIELPSNIGHDRARRKRRGQNPAALFETPPPPTLRTGHHRHMGHAVLLSALISSPYERSFTTEPASRKAAYGRGILPILVAGLLSGCVVVEPREGHHGGWGWGHYR